MLLDQLLLDARFGLRQLVRSPLVAAVAILTLAIGIGLNTAVFSLVNAVLLRPLPYPHSERLVWIAPYDERFGQDTFASRGDYLVWKQQPQVFERMAAYGTQDLNLIVGGEASQERVASIGGDFWELTGARPVLGRVLADDDEQGVLLSYGLFQRRFGGVPTTIGQGVEISGVPFTIVGVLPATFRVTFPQQTAPGDELRDIDAFISLPRGPQRPGTTIKDRVRGLDTIRQRRPQLQQQLRLIAALNDSDRVRWHALQIVQRHVRGESSLQRKDPLQIEAPLIELRRHSQVTRSWCPILHAENSRSRAPV